MNARARVDVCGRFRCSIGAYVDGELDADHAVDLEAHAIDCGDCAEHVALLRATRCSLKRTCSKSAPDRLKTRLFVAMQEERARLAALEARTEIPRRGYAAMGLRYVAPLAAAAGVVFAVGAARGKAASAEAHGEALMSRESIASTVDTVLDDLVALHAHPLPPETTNPEELPQFDPLVGVPVRRPAFQPFDANFRGARVHAMKERRAALLHYTVGGRHRVTVYVFDARTVPVHDKRLRQQLIRERNVYVGTMRGYSVAAGEKSGIGYALASDLNADESTELVMAALQ